MAVGGGIVEVGDGSGGEIAEDAGKIWLGMTVVAAADEDAGDRVEEAGADGAGALVEIAGVLMKEGGKDGSAHVGAGDEVAEVGTVAPAVAGSSLAVAAKGIGCLLEAGDGSDESEIAGVGCVLPGESEFLTGGERRGVPLVADEEVRDDAQQALSFLDVELLLGGVGRVG